MRRRPEDPSCARRRARPGTALPAPGSRGLLLLAGALLTGASWAGYSGAAAETGQTPPAAEPPAVFQALSAEDAQRVAALVKGLGSDDWNKREAASADLDKVGEGAIPALLAVAESSDVEVAQRATELLGKLVPKSRIHGLLRAKRPPPEIVGELGGWERAFAVLRGCLELPKAAERFELRARAFALIGACGRPAVPVLTESLAGADERQAEVAAAWLAEIGPEASGAVPGLVKALGGGRPALRQNSARALGAIGGAAREALPALEKLLEDPATGVRIEAALAVWRLAGKAAVEKTLAALTKALGDSDVRLRVAALQALGAMGSEAAGAVPEIARTLGDPKLCEQALIVLGAMGPAAKEALPAVQARLEDKNDVVRLRASVAQMQIGDRGAAAVKVLVEALAHKDRRVCEFAIRLLGDLGPAAKEAVAELEKRLGDKNLRGPAAEALRKIRGEDAGK